MPFSLQEVSWDSDDINVEYKKTSCLLILLLKYSIDFVNPPVLSVLFRAIFLLLVVISIKRR